MNRKFMHYVIITITDIAIKTFLISLQALAFGGIAFIVFHMITNPIAFSNASFGIMG